MLYYVKSNHNIKNNFKLNSKMEYKITNYFNDSYVRTIAEVIPHGKLKDQMTNHGLGSGFYGFIDVNPEKESIQLYNRNGNTQVEFYMQNPLVLTGDHNFYIFSTSLNSIITDIYKASKTMPLTDDLILKHVIDFEYYSFEKESVTETFKPSKEILIRSIKNFLLDYEKLMKTDKEEENYIFMPINYIMNDCGFDGIYNISGDYASRGSVCYKFDKSYPVRGYPVTFKHRPPMKGRLIYLN